MMGSLVLGAAACGGGGGGGGSSYTQPDGASTETVTIKSGNVYFDPNKVDLPPAIVTVELVNVEAGPHTLVIQGVKGFELQVTRSGDKDSLKVELQPGSHEFWCTIPGHRAAGMEGTFTVG